MTENHINNLNNFFRDSGQSHARESILMNRLIYDLKLAAALRGYHLESYTSDVDHEGFDIIFDDQDQFKKIQVKTVMHSSTTKGWNIHKRLLRPQLYASNQLGFESSPTGEGVQGGVLLMEVNPSGSSLEVKYYYTDIMILIAFYLGVISRSRPSFKKVVAKALNALHIGQSHEMVSIPKSCFLSTANPEQVLALAGFHNNINTCCWINNLLEYSALKLSNSGHQTGIPDDKVRAFIADELRECTNDNTVFA